MVGCCLERKLLNKGLSSGNKVTCFINGIPFSGLSLTPPMK